MIFDSIELYRVGRFNHRIKVGPFAPGLNILAAPNEQGKSTLLKAATRCLFDRHTTKALEIQALQPAGTDLVPEITVQFRTNQGQFRLKKRFLHAPSSLLCQLRGQEWIEIGDGDQADNRVFEMLCATQPGRGASKPEHWGLVQYLWGRQDEASRWPGWNGESGEWVKRTLTRVDIDPCIERVRERLIDHFEINFTPTGQVKKSGDLFRVEEEIRKLEAERQRVVEERKEIEARQAEFQNLAADVELIGKQRLILRDEAEQLGDRLRELAATRKEIQETEKEYRQANQALQTTHADRVDLSSSQRVIENGRLRLAAFEAELGGLADKEPALLDQIRQLEQQMASSESQKADLRNRLGRAKMILKWEAQKEKVAAGRELAKQIAELGAALEVKQKKRSELPRISGQQKETLRGLELQARELEIELQGAGLQVQLLSKKRVTVSLRDESEEREIILQAQVPATVQGRQSLKLDLPRWGQIVIQSGSKEIRALEEQRKEKVAALSELKQKLGVESAAQAETIFEEGRELDRDVKTLQRELGKLLESGETQSQFRNRLAGQEANVRQLEGQLGVLAEEEQGRPRVDWEGCVLELEAALDGQEGQLQTQTVALREAHKKFQELLVARNAIQAEAVEVRGCVAQAGGQIGTIQARYPAGIEATLSKAQAEYVQAQARLKVAREKLPAEADRLPERRERAVRAAVQAENEYETKRQQEARLEGALNREAAAGLYSIEVELAEKIEVLRLQAEVLRRQAKAARLLAVLIEHRKALAVRTVLEPLEQRLTVTFAEITGDFSRHVYLDEQLAILGIGRTRDEHYSFDSLSEGAKEQLLLALRAAVATELAEEGPQLLILDDVLVNTDPLRQVRVLDYLQTLSQRVQILILTCHPDRYAGIGTAVHFSAHVG